MRARRNIFKPDFWQILESKLQPKMEIVILGQKPQTREFSCTMTSAEIIELVISYLGITEISLLGGVNKYFKRECQQSKHYRYLNFADIPVMLTQSMIISKIGFAYNHLQTILLPSYMRHSEYKK